MDGNQELAPDDMHHVYAIPLSQWLAEDKSESGGFEASRFQVLIEVCAMIAPRIERYGLLRNEPRVAVNYIPNPIDPAYPRVQTLFFFKAENNGTTFIIEV